MGWVFMRLKPRPGILAVGSFPDKDQDVWQKLEARGFDVERIEAIEPGVARACVQRFDLLLFDARTQTLEQLQSLLRQLRSEPDHRNAFTPLVIMVEQMPDAESIAEWRSRINAMIDSPISSTLMLTKIFTHCSAQPVHHVA